MRLTALALIAASAMGCSRFTPLSPTFPPAAKIERVEGFEPQLGDVLVGMGYADDLEAARLHGADVAWPFNQPRGAVAECRFYRLGAGLEFADLAGYQRFERWKREEAASDASPDLSGVQLIRLWVSGGYADRLTARPFAHWWYSPHHARAEVWSKGGAQWTVPDVLRNEGRPPLLVTNVHGDPREALGLEGLRELWVVVDAEEGGSEVQALSDTHGGEVGKGGKDRTYARAAVPFTVTVIDPATELVVARWASVAKVNRSYFGKPNSDGLHRMAAVEATHAVAQQTLRWLLGDPPQQ